MKNKKIKFTFLSAIFCLGLIGCSSDDSVDNSDNKSESGVISNDEITLTYGAELLKHYSEDSNSRILLINGVAARSGNSLPTYQNQNIDGATDVMPLSNINTVSGTVYYVPAEQTYSGSINLVSGAKLIVKGTFAGTLNFNGAAEVYVEGAFNSSNQVNIAPNGKMIVGPNASFGVNTVVHINSNGQIDNYGVFKYKSNTIDGIIENYKTLTFEGDYNFTVNGNGIIRNHCQVVFKKASAFDGKFYNNSKATLENGFSINSSGRIYVASGSYTHVTQGQLKIDGKVENLSENILTDRARIDLDSNVTKGNPYNANPAFKGAIDINTTLTATDLKTASEVVFNYNTYIPTSDCIDVTLGTVSCTGSSVNLSYSGIYQSPVVNNITLSATDVRVLNGKAYVSYHTNDEEFGDSPYGSIRVFNITDPANPELIAQADFKKAEFNSLEIKNNTLYAVGNNKAGAIMYTAPLNNGTFVNDLNAIKSHSLPSLSAKNIYFNGNDIWLTSSGATGGLFKLNSADFSISSTVESKSGAKYVVANTSNHVFLALDNGNPYVRFADASGSVLFGGAKSYEDINLNVTDGKNSLALDTNNVYAALSDKGVAKFKLSTGDLVGQFIPNEFRGLDGFKVLKKNGRSNAVAVEPNGCFLYIANGSDGVVVLNKMTMEYVGHFELTNQKSANFVYNSDNYLFVASGRNGFAIINK